MLNSLRSSISGWTVKILLGLLILSFAFWGIGDMFRGSTASTVMTAGDTEVSVQEYALAYQQAQARLSQQFGQQLSPEQLQMLGLQQGVVSQLVSSAVLDEQARSVGLGITDERLARVIANDPSFRTATGAFSPDAFRAALARAGIPEDTYIQSQRAAALRTQVVDAVSEGVGVPAAFTTARGLYDGERRTIDYVTLTTDAIEPVGEPDAETLQSYFDANRERYTAPEYRSISIAELTPQTLADPSSVTDEEIAADYEANEQRYSEAERRQVRQIVFPDEAAAEAASQRLADGADFSEVAVEAGLTLSDTDLGMVSRTDLPDPAIADAAFALDEGETSGVVDGRFGPAILQVTAIEAGQQQPLAEVSDRIREELALRNAGEELNAAYNAFEDARAGGATFAEAAQTAGIPAATIDAVDQQGNTPDGEPAAELPDNPAVLRNAFEAEPGFDPLPITLNPAGSLFYTVNSVEPARQLELDEVRERVAADWQAEQRSERLNARADELREAVDGGRSITDVAQSLGVEVETAPAITRQSGAGSIGQPGVEAAFSVASDGVASAPGPAGETRLIMQVREVAPPASPAANVAASVRERMTAQLQNDILDSYVTVLQNQTPVSINRAGLDRAEAMIR